MARTVTLAVMRTRVRQRADAEGDTHVTDAEIDGLINDAYCSFYDAIIASCPPDYFRTTYAFTTVSGTVQYALPSDFYKLRQLYVTESQLSGIYRPIEQVDEVARYVFRAPDTAQAMRLDYIPVAATLSADGDIVDGINGWDEAIVLQAAIDIKNKKEDDASGLSQKLGRVMKRIEQMSPRDEGSPRHVIQRNLYGRRGFRNYGDNYVRADIDGYTLVGGYVEVYRHAGPIIS